ncbi:MAG: glycosyltransferase [Cryobacterium sp.]|uniref:glycosyltransferase n=1 Tax=unclassified Cryobacterium TaxID=2649013 RepID=UPI0018CBB783|nr:MULTISPECIES: glycosyltransferase [unclassified Cryobacterium]MCY7405471.1 glycosyltransferase [Cryobacterium sp.]MEC5153504.1 glycosyltransferase involved in cell wall biosynthesis [Cryobacterium sp. CAN_C3]
MTFSSQTVPNYSHSQSQLRRILFVIPSLHGGGAEFVARTWMGWLADQGYEVSVVLTAAEVRPEYLPDGVDAHSLAGAHGHVRKTAALRRRLLDWQPDVALSLQAHPNLVLLSAARLVPARLRPRVLVSERNLVSLGLPGSNRAHRAKVWLAKRLYRWADHVIAISHPVAAEMVAAFGVRGDRITVVANPATAKLRGTPRGQGTTQAHAQVAGGELSGTEPSSTTIVTRSERRPGTTNGIQIVLACRLVAQKRPLLAIAAAAELARRGVPVEVVSFGGGPLLDDVQAAARHENVVFHHRGWVENWFDHFGDNAVALLTSSREGFGNVLVEAAAAGYPAVAISGALGVADAIVPGITGELALSAHPVDLADAILRAADLSLHNIEPWLARFSEEASGADLERVLLRVVERA